jgi:chromosome segregation ATPase
MTEAPKFPCDCQDTSLIRKQREEILLLIKELNEQQEQFNHVEKCNLKLKQNLKQNENERLEYEAKAKSLNSEIQLLKNEREKQKEISEQLRQKLTQKDFFIQNQSKKLQQTQSECEKLKLNVSDLNKDNKALKLENFRLKSSHKDQSKRVLDLRDKVAEHATIIEQKNQLLNISSDQIQILEKNLNCCMKTIADFKEKEAKQQLKLRNESEECLNNDKSSSQNENLVNLLQVRRIFLVYRLE